MLEISSLFSIRSESLAIRNIIQIITAVTTAMKMTAKAMVPQGTREVVNAAAISAGILLMAVSLTQSGECLI